MIKSWLISLFILLLLIGAYYINLFEWLAGTSAMLIGVGLVVVMLGVAFFVLGNPLKK